MRHWLEIRSAYRVGKLGTVSAAAEDLGVHRTTITRHIDLLEADLGVKLFLRDGGRYTVTDVGRAFLKMAQGAEDLVFDFVNEAKIGSSAFSNEIMIATDTSLAALLMRPMIAFRKQQPEISVVVIAQSEEVKLEHGEAHVAVYPGSKPTQPDYVVQPLKNLRFGFYAHASYVERRSLPKTEAELFEHDVIANPEMADRMPIEAWLLAKAPDARLLHRTSYPKATHDAIFSGAALGILPELFASDRDDLQVVLEPRDEWSLPLWLMSHVDIHHTQKVQLMTACVKEELGVARQSLGRT